MLISKYGPGKIKDNIDHNRLKCLFNVHNIIIFQYIITEFDKIFNGAFNHVDTTIIIMLGLHTRGCVIPKGQSRVFMYK